MYTIVIPVHNAFEHFERCLRSVLENTNLELVARVIVMDDGSSDERIGDICSGYGLGVVDYYRHETAIGFVSTVNQVIVLTDRDDTDLIVLNSDTVVPPRWVERLDQARHSVRAPGAQVAAVSPLSNNATIYSVPTGGELHPLHTQHFDLVVQAATQNRAQYPSIPTVHGFCMLLTREALNKIGSFDELFSPGYGEEVDWSQRARAAWMDIVLCDDLFVYHAGRASFGDRRADLALRAEENIRQRWPDYEQDVREWVDRDPLCTLKTRLVEATEPGRFPSLGWKIRVAHVQHSIDARAGVENLTRWLTQQNHGGLVQSVIVPGYTGPDYQQTNHEFRGPTHVVRVNQALDLPALSIRGVPTEYLNKRLAALRDVLAGLGAQVVQVNHMIGWGDPLELMRTIRRSGSKIVLALHDDFAMCPRLMDVPCDFKVAGGGQCVSCVSEVLEFYQYVDRDQIGRYLSRRGDSMARALDEADAVVVPSMALKEKLTSAYGAEHTARIRVIQNGVPLPKCSRDPRRGGDFRIAFLGNCTASKGFEAFIKATTIIDNETEFWAVGAVESRCWKSIANHQLRGFCGPYEPEDLAGLLNQFDAVVPALAHNEAYGLVVDECIAAHCPIILPDLPAIRERVRVAYWYDWGDATSLACAIREFCTDAIEHPEFGSKLPNFANNTVRSIEECAADYLALYRELLA